MQQVTVVRTLNRGIFLTESRVPESQDSAITGKLGLPYSYFLLCSGSLAPKLFWAKYDLCQYRSHRTRDSDTMTATQSYGACLQLLSSWHVSRVYTAIARLSERCHRRTLEHESKHVATLVSVASPSHITGEPQAVCAGHQCSRNKLFVISDRELSPSAHHTSDLEVRRYCL